MPQSILMPALSPTMTEGKLAKWLKAEGDTVEAGDVIAEIETDKATMEVEAVDEGTIGKILISAGTDGVAVNTAIAILLEEGEDKSALDNFKAESGNDNASPAKKEEKPAASSAPSTAPVASPQSTNSSTRIFASPLAKRIAKDKGIDLSQIKGSGPRGRIVKADVERAPAGGARSGQGPRTAPTSSGPDARALADMLGMSYTAEPHSKMRQVIASRLLESKQTIPHFYLTVECQIDALLDARRQINEIADGVYKISVNDFMIKAVANALHKFPDANVAWTDTELVRYDHADVSVAVATPNGLITPIIKQAETKTLRQISSEMKDLAARARDNKLRPEEFQGGTFSVSNLGMFGIKEFSAIINPPQACILAIGAGQEKVYAENGQVKTGNFVNCTLSVDHRAVDGAVGAQYLQVFKSLIENPVALVMEG